jgi:hypothetical protein
MNSVLFCQKTIDYIFNGKDDDMIMDLIKADHRVLLDLKDIPIFSKQVQLTILINTLSCYQRDFELIVNNYSFDEDVVVTFFQKHLSYTYSMPKRVLFLVNSQHVKTYAIIKLIEKIKMTKSKALHKIIQTLENHPKMNSANLIVAQLQIINEK